MSDWSSDVCSADLLARARRRSVILGKGVDEQDMLVESIQRRVEQKVSPRSDLALARSRAAQVRQQLATTKAERQSALMRVFQFVGDTSFDPGTVPIYGAAVSHRSEEHTSELQSLMRISYAVFCLKQKTQKANTNHDINNTI